jgi:hypothetical protein
LAGWPKRQQQAKENAKNCAVCHKNKPEIIPYLGLLQPLSILDMAWTHISMDFVEDLPKSQGKDVILIVVDRLTKYSHFISNSYPYTAQDIVTYFFIISSNYMSCQRLSSKQGSNIHK